MNQNYHFPQKRQPFIKNHGTHYSILFFTIFCLIACQGNGNEQQKSTGNIWETSSLDEANINPELIFSLIQNINEGVYQNVHSLLLIKDGKLFASGDDGLDMEMVPLSKTRFIGTALNLFDVCFEFTLSPDQKALGVVGIFGFTNKTSKKIS